MAAANLEVLAKAMERQIPAIISAGEGLARREMMIQFTSTRAESNAPGFWARVHEGDNKVMDQLIKSADPVAITFNTENRRVNFNTSLLKRRRHNLIQRLLLIRWPEQIAVVEQRQKKRIWVPDRFRLASKIEVFAHGGDNIGTATARVWDIGMEGASIICPASPFLLKLTGDNSIKLTIRAPDAEKAFAFMGTHRYVTRLSDEAVRVGVQFDSSADPAAAPAQRALKSLIDELDALCGSYDIMGALNHRGGGSKTMRMS